METTISRQSEQLLNASDIAHILNISRAMAYRLMQLGMIRSVSIGTAKRVRPKDLDDFILQNLVPRNSSK